MRCPFRSALPLSYIQNKVRWPVGLKRLQFGSNFKQVISGVDWPESLEAVTFGSYFNNPVDDVKW